MPLRLKTETTQRMGENIKNHESDMGNVKDAGLVCPPIAKTHKGFRHSVSVTLEKLWSRGHWRAYRRPTRELGPGSAAVPPYHPSSQTPPAGCALPGKWHQQASPLSAHPEITAATRQVCWKCYVCLQPHSVSCYKKCGDTNPPTP